ncbi:AhpC/TSA antioxidant enzyme-domain-containing protein [Naematelia encephala]|uniref:AhpC/TSA antioxidant enzyme-domain-containing protein n=1 Tax=Naematelia encephala TaxID=71784 RepID=A0A1Y2BBP2_9TREE|nr:AhpC/TSA antioxidant enzyme-domain-containing protein [Naematelia encephala]
MIASPRLTSISLNSTDELVPPSPSPSQSTTTTATTSISPRLPSTATATTLTTVTGSPPLAQRSSSPSNSTPTHSRSNSLRRKPVPSYLAMPERSPTSNSIQLPAGHPFFAAATTSSPSQGSINGQDPKEKSSSPLTPGSARMEDELFYSPPRGPVPPKRTSSRTGLNLNSKFRSGPSITTAVNVEEDKKDPVPISSDSGLEERIIPNLTTPAVNEEQDRAEASTHVEGAVPVEPVDPLRPSTFHGLNINLNLGEPISVNQQQNKSSDSNRSSPTPTPSIPPQAETKTAISGTVTPTTANGATTPITTNDFATTSTKTNGVIKNSAIHKNLPPLPKEDTPALGHSMFHGGSVNSIPSPTTSTPTTPTPRQNGQGIEYRSPPRARTPLFSRKPKGSSRNSSSSRPTTPVSAGHRHSTAHPPVLESEDDTFSIDRVPSQRRLWEVSTMFLRDEEGGLVCFGDFFPPATPESVTSNEIPTTPDISIATGSSSSSSSPSTPTTPTTPTTIQKVPTTVSQSIQKPATSPGVAPPKWRKTIVFFIRFFWCGQCQDYTFASLSQLDKAELERQGIRVVVISSGSWKIIKSYRKLFNCEFPIYVDGPRRLYQLMGMTKMNNNFGPFFKGRASYHQRPVPTQVLKGLENAWFRMPLYYPGKMTQLGGEFILGPGHTCEFAHRMTNTSNHMEAPDVLRIAGIEHPTKTEIAQFKLEAEQQAELERLQGEMKTWKEERQQELERIRQRKAARRGETYTPTAADQEIDVDEEDLLAEYPELDNQDEGYEMVENPTSFESKSDAIGSTGIEERFRKIMMQEEQARKGQEEEKTVRLVKPNGLGNVDVQIEA